MIQEIFIIDEEKTLMDNLTEMFKKDKNYKFKMVRTKELDIALKNIPALFIINEDTTEDNVIEIAKRIRENEDNNITPIIVISSNKNKEHRIQILETSVEYMIGAPADQDYLYYTIKNIIRLIYTNRKISPLTGLPGNVQIHAELKKRLLKKEKFSVLYLDLDNFKAYNDVYGFLKGDEIIKFTAQIILKNVHMTEGCDSFVGHIGGDDFVAIVGNVDYESICQSIIAEFDEGVKRFFNEEDNKKGYIEVANRKNVMEQFPLTSISIGVVDVTENRFYNLLEIGEVGAQVKHLAKTVMGSAYVIDRRKE